MSEAATGAHHSRYSRQSRVFGSARRASTALCVLHGGQKVFGLRMQAAAAACAGFPLVITDGAPEEGGGHWMRGRLGPMFDKVNPEIRHLGLDRDFAEDLEFLRRFPNALVSVAWGNNPGLVRESLEMVATHAGQVPVIITVCGPGGVAVLRYPTAVEAMSFANSVGEVPVPSGPIELELVAAGYVAAEVMRPAESPLQGEVTAAYSLHHPRRIPDTRDLRTLAESIARPVAGAQIRMSGRRIHQVGAGALGNWFVLGLEGGLDLTVYDADRVEASNANRQILVAPHLGLNKAEAICAELEAMDPAGRHHAIPRNVRQEKDFECEQEGSPEILVALPDNDACRALCSDYAETRGLLFGTAGTSAFGGQVVVAEHACYACLNGTGNADPGEMDLPGGNSCALVAEDSVVSTNMIGAGLLISELRAALSERGSANVRFGVHQPGGNGIARMLTNPRCAHRGMKKKPA